MCDAQVGRSLGPRSGRDWTCQADCARGQPGHQSQSLHNELLLQRLRVALQLSHGARQLAAQVRHRRAPGPRGPAPESSELGETQQGQIYVGVFICIDICI